VCAKSRDLHVNCKAAGCERFNLQSRAWLSVFCIATLLFLMPPYKSPKVPRSISQINILHLSSCLHMLKDLSLVIFNPTHQPPCLCPNSSTTFANTSSPETQAPHHTTRSQIHQPSPPNSPESTSSILKGNHLSASHRRVVVYTVINCNNPKHTLQYAQYSSSTVVGVSRLAETHLANPPELNNAFRSCCRCCCCFSPAQAPRALPRHQASAQNFLPV
jgi:hypothetical protein